MYHVNPETGKTNICKAVKKPCRFGNNYHYVNESDALQAGEKLFSGNKVFSKVKKGESLKEKVLDSMKYLDKERVSSYDSIIVDSNLGQIFFEKNIDFPDDYNPDYHDDDLIDEHHPYGSIYEMYDKFGEDGEKAYYKYEINIIPGRSIEYQFDIPKNVLDK